MVVYSAAALRSGLFPLLIIVVMPLLGGDFDSRGLLRAAAYGVIGLAVAGISGYIRWSTTRWWIDETAVHHHTGLLRKSDTKVPLERIEGLDVHQGPLQRAFGVFALDVQTGAGKKGGEIALPALTPAAVEDLRAARASGSAVAVDAEPAESHSRRLSRRELAITAVTAGQLGVLLPVLAALGQVVSQVGENEQEDAFRFLPHSVTVAVLVVVGLLVAAWLISILGSVIAFGGFTIVREEERILDPARAHRPQRGDGAGRPRTGRARGRGPAAAAVRAVRADRRGHRLRRARPARRGRCSRVVRVSDVRAFLDEFLPELADDPGALSRPPARAARRYVAPSLVLAVLVAVGAVVPRRRVLAARARAHRVRLGPVARRGLAPA